MTNQEKQQLRSELSDVKARLALIDEKLSKVEIADKACPKQPRRMTLLEWMNWCADSSAQIKIFRAGQVVATTKWGAVEMSGFSYGKLGIDDLTEQWEEVL